MRGRPELDLTMVSGPGYFSIHYLKFSLGGNRGLAAVYTYKYPLTKRRASVLLDVSPLRKHRDFRLLFVGQLVSAFGTFLTYVAFPVQVFELTKSSAVVGL